MADTPFGASFGNPNRYIGSSPIGDIWKGLKTGASVYAMQATGLTDYLDKLGVKQKKDGSFSFEGQNPTAVPAGPVAGAIAPSLSEAQLAAGSNWGAMGGQSPATVAGAVAPDGIAQVPQAGGPLFSSYNPVTATNVYGVNTGVNKEFAPANQSSQIELPVPKSKLSGEDLLDGKISVANPNDFNPAEGGGYTQQLASGNEYQQQPGYGKTKKLLSSLFGIA
jgi:hypothetical protein